MRIESTSTGAAGLAGLTGAVRAQAQPSSVQSQDTVKLSAMASNDGDSGAVSQVSGMLTASPADALAAHSRIDPERALRLLGLLD